jgi:putative SOS response-associated peptidase YedK
LIEPIHDRMPAILPPNQWDRWLDSANSDASDLLSLLQPYPSDEMEAIAVSTVVNNSRHEGPDCLAPAA